jgi:glutathione S-transferase
MHLLQFSTSHYCRKARLALGYKQIPYQVENLTPGLHRLRLQPLTSTATLPVLIPQTGGETGGEENAIADSSDIFQFLDQYQPDPLLLPTDPVARRQALQIEDWLDESIGTATRFVYYQFRSKEGKSLDASLVSQVIIQVVRRQYGITERSAAAAAKRLDLALDWLHDRWQSGYLVGNQLSVADLTAAALLSPLARIPVYRQQADWLFQQIAAIHQQCQEPLPPGLGSLPTETPVGLK